MHGVFVGGYYSIVRILKCGPWSTGGVDEVKK
jgi:putative component of membrane protein insertase Oxa1/YidC/SpoIIIJ protein YidD